MDVNFPRAPALINEEILIQQMVECQNGLNREYNNKLNGIRIIAKMKSSLQNYLDLNHPGQVVPENGDHFQVMMSVFEEIAVMTMEMTSYYDGELQQYREEADRVFSKMNSYNELNTTHTTVTSVSPDDFDEQLKMWEERKNILQSARDALDVMVQKRLDCERVHWKLTGKMQKIMDMARAEADGNGEGAGAGPDPFLGILRKGIYASLLGLEEEVQWEQFERMTETWPSLKEREENFVKWITKQISMVDLTLPIVRATIKLQRSMEELKVKEEAEQDGNCALALEGEPEPKVRRQKKKRKVRRSKGPRVSESND